jgi:hypothetical protein
MTVICLFYGRWRQQVHSDDLVWLQENSMKVYRNSMTLPRACSFSPSRVVRDICQI